MRNLFVFFFLTLACCGQTVVDAAESEQTVFTGTTPAFSITASQGNGDICVINKFTGATVKFSFSCASSDSTSSWHPGPMIFTGTTMRTTGITWGDVYCLIVVNPTGTAGSMDGNFPNIPAKSLSLSCTTNTAAGGQTPPVAATVTWP